MLSVVVALPGSLSLSRSLLRLRLLLRSSFVAFITFIDYLFIYFCLRFKSLFSVFYDYYLCTYHCKTSLGAVEYCVIQGGGVQSETWTSVVICVNVREGGINISEVTVCGGLPRCLISVS